jgi:hypothetical protein
MRFGSLEAKIRQNIIVKTVVILEATVCLAGLLVPIAWAGPDAQKPNIIFILTDDHRKGAQIKVWTPLPLSAILSGLAALYLMMLWGGGVHWFSKKLNFGDYIYIYAFSQFFIIWHYT